MQRIEKVHQNRRRKEVHPRFGSDVFRFYFFGWFSGFQPLYSFRGRDSFTGTLRMPKICQTSTVAQNVEKVRPRKLTWQWKNSHLKMYLLLKIGIFQCHVNFRGSWQQFFSLNGPINCLDPSKWTHQNIKTTRVGPKNQSPVGVKWGPYK